MSAHRLLEGMQSLSSIVLSGSILIIRGAILLVSTKDHTLWLIPIEKPIIYGLLVTLCRLRVFSAQI